MVRFPPWQDLFQILISLYGLEIEPIGIRVVSRRCRLLNPSRKRRVATRATATQARVNQAEPKAIWSSPPEEKDRLEHEVHENASECPRRRFWMFSFIEFLTKPKHFWARNLNQRILRSKINIHSGLVCCQELSSMPSSIGLHMVLLTFLLSLC